MPPQPRVIADAAEIAVGMYGDLMPQGDKPPHWMTLPPGPEREAERAKLVNLNVLLADRAEREDCDRRRRHIAAMPEGPEKALAQREHTSYVIRQNHDPAIAGGRTWSERVNQASEEVTRSASVYTQPWACPTCTFQNRAAARCPCPLLRPCGRS